MLKTKLYKDYDKFICNNMSSLASFFKPASNYYLEIPTRNSEGHLWDSQQKFLASANQSQVKACAEDAQRMVSSESDSEPPAPKDTKSNAAKNLKINAGATYLSDEISGEEPLQPSAASPCMLKQISNFDVHVYSQLRSAPFQPQKQLSGIMPSKFQVTRRLRSSKGDPEWKIVKTQKKTDKIKSKLLLSTFAELLGPKDFRFKRSGKIDNEISRRIVDGNPASEEQIKAIEDFMRRMNQGELPTLGTLWECSGRMKLLEKPINKQTSTQSGQAKLFMLEASLLLKVQEMAMQAQQKKSSAGRVWSKTLTEGAEIFLQNVPDLCLYFDKTGSTEQQTNDGQYVIIKGFCRKDEVWCKPDNEKEWVKSSTTPQQSDDIEEVEYHHLCLAKVLHRAYQQQNKNTDEIKIRGAPIDANVQINMHIRLPGDEPVILKCTDSKTRKLSMEECIAVQRRIVVFSNGAGGDTNMNFVRSRPDQGLQGATLLDPEQFRDLYQVLQNQLSKNKRAQKLVVRGPHVLWARDVILREGVQYVEIEGKVFFLQKDLVKMWHVRWLQSLFPHFSWIFNEMRQNHPSTIQHNTIFMNKNLKYSDMLDFRRIFEKYNGMPIVVFFDDHTDDSQVAKSSARNMSYFPLLVKMCQQYRATNDQELLKKILNILRLKIKQDLKDTVHRQKEGHDMWSLIQGLNPDAFRKKTNLFIPPGCSILQEADKRDQVQAFCLAHAIRWEQSAPKLSFDAFTHANSVEQRETQVPSHIKHLSMREISNIDKQQSSWQTEALQKASELTELFIKSFNERKSATDISHVQTATIDLCGQNLLVHADFEVELLKKDAPIKEDNLFPVAVAHRANDNTGRVLNLRGFRNFLQRKIRNVTFQNFYLHFENVGTKVPAGVYETHNSKLSQKILKESPGLSKNEYQQNNYYVNRQLQNTFIKSGGKDYQIFFNGDNYTLKPYSEDSKPIGIKQVADSELARHLANNTLTFSIEAWKKFKIQTKAMELCIKAGDNYYLLHFSPEKYWKFPEKFINSYPENAPLSAVFSRHAQFMRLCSQFRTNAPQFSHASIMAMCQNIEKMSDHRAYLTENMQALLSVLYDDVTRRHIRLKHALNFTENDTKAVQVDIPRLINRLLTAIDKNFSKIGSKMDFEQALRIELEAEKSDFDNCFPVLDDKDTLLKILQTEVTEAVHDAIEQPRIVSLSQNGVVFALQKTLPTLHKLAALWAFDTSFSVTKQDWNDKLVHKISANIRTQACNMIISNANSQEKFLHVYTDIMQWTQEILDAQTFWPSIALYHRMQMHSSVILHEIAVSWYNAITQDLVHFEADAGKTGLKRGQNVASYAWHLLRGYFLPFKSGMEVSSHDKLMQKIGSATFEDTLFLGGNNERSTTFNPLLWPPNKPLLKHLIELDLVEVLQYVWPLAEKFTNSLEGGPKIWETHMPGLWNSAFYHKSDRCIAWFVGQGGENIKILLKALPKDADPEQEWNTKLNNEYAKYSHLEDKSLQLVKRREYDAGYYAKFKKLLSVMEEEDALRKADSVEKGMKPMQQDNNTQEDHADDRRALPVIQEEDASRKADSVERRGMEPMQQGNNTLEDVKGEGDDADDASGAMKALSIRKNNPKLYSKIEQRQMRVAPAAGTGDLTAERDAELNSVQAFEQWVGNLNDAAEDALEGPDHATSQSSKEKSQKSS